jgi:hemerythrin superfamily protein
MPVKLRDVSTLFIREVPAQLHAAFRAGCALRRISMRKKIIEMLRDELKKWDKPPSK